jgi:putative transposase
MLKQHPHTPAHLFLDDTPYFVTGGIYRKRMLLANPEIKHSLLDLLQTCFDMYNWELHHWVILDNHYHVLGISREGKDLTNIFRKVHSKAAISIRQLTHCAKPVWWNYWDYCPRDETDYMVRCNYLLNNPVKHGYVMDLRDYPFSSFHTLLANLVRERLVKQFRDYPDYKTLILHEAK